MTSFLVLGVLIIAGLASLVCWIMTIIRMFKMEGALLGILSICGLIGFILGWVKVREHNSMKLMLVWTAAILVSIPMQIISSAAGIGASR